MGDDIEILVAVEDKGGDCIVMDTVTLDKQYWENLSAEGKYSEIESNLHLIIDYDYEVLNG